MIGDRWTSPRTGRTYIVGPPGTQWKEVGTGLFATLGQSLAVIAGAAMFAGSVAVGLALMVGFLTGLMMIYLPMAIPYTIPGMLLAGLIMMMRTLATRRRFKPMALALVLILVFVAEAIVHAVFWYHTLHSRVYDAIASLPLMVIVTLGLSIFLTVKRKKVWAVLAWTQTGSSGLRV